MVRALAFCAVILAACTAAAQTVKPAKDSAATAAPTLAASEPSPVSTCGEHECPAVTAAASTEMPTDEHALLKQKLAELNCLQSEIDGLRRATGMPNTIRLGVKVVEVSRTKCSQLGVDLGALRGKASVGAPEARPPKPTCGGLAFGIILEAGESEGLLEKLRQGNVGKVLAEPTIVMVCDRPASLNVGGEIPSPTAAGAGRPVEHKPYGTQIDVMAKALGDHRVRLDFRARVSDVDYTHAIEVAGVHVPAVNHREVDTGVELAFGQTGVLSGMVQRRHEAVKAGETTAIQINEIETMFFITPAAEYAKTPGASDTEASYRAADSASEPRYGERSLRVTKPTRSR